MCVHTFMLNNYLVVDFHKRDTNQKLSVCSLWDYNISINIIAYLIVCRSTMFYRKSMKFVTKEAIQSVYMYM